MFLGYWNRPDATRDKFIGDWLRTGDRGSMDEDGYLWFQARNDDVITSAGYRIGPGEIEDCLLRHPAVADGRRGRRAGSRPDGDRQGVRRARARATRRRPR